MIPMAVRHFGSRLPSVSPARPQPGNWLCRSALVLRSLYFMLGRFSQASSTVQSRGLLSTGACIRVVERLPVEAERPSTCKAVEGGMENATLLKQRTEGEGSTRIPSGLLCRQVGAISHCQSLQKEERGWVGRVYLKYREIVGRNRAERCGGYNLHTSPGGWEGSLDTNGRAPFWLKAAFSFPRPPTAWKLVVSLRSRLTISLLHAWEILPSVLDCGVERPTLHGCVHSCGRGGCQGSKEPLNLRSSRGRHAKCHSPEREDRGGGVYKDPPPVS